MLPARDERAAALDLALGPGQAEARAEPAKGEAWADARADDVRPAFSRSGRRELLEFVLTRVADPAQVGPRREAA
jgi:hypothetical protein